MANKKITDLTADPSITGTEEIPVQDSTNNYKVTIDQIADYSETQWSAVTGATADLTTTTKTTLVAAINEVKSSNDTETTNRGTAVSAVQSEVDAIETGAGLNTGGTYSANGSANYISGATSLKDADNKLDAQIKTNADAIAGKGQVNSVTVSGDTTNGLDVSTGGTSSNPTAQVKFHATNAIKPASINTPGNIVAGGNVSITGNVTATNLPAFTLTLPANYDDIVYYGGALINQKHGLSPMAYIGASVSYVLDFSQYNEVYVDTATATGATTMTINGASTAANIGRELLIIDTGNSAATKNITITTSGAEVIYDAGTEGNVVIAVNSGYVRLKIVATNKWIVIGSKIS